MKRIIGTQYNGISRVVDMLCLSFGNTIGVNILVHDGTSSAPTGVPEYSLHVQTQWRFTHNNKIMLASRDIYEPFSQETCSNWDYSQVGRTDEESSVFDVKAKTFNTLMTNSIVANCMISAFGDIQILFNNGVVFEVFIPASTEDEEWRLIDYTQDEHLIFHDV